MSEFKYPIQRVANNQELPLVEKGYVAARVFDKAVAELKKEKIRERFRIL